MWSMLAETKFVYFYLCLYFYLYFSFYLYLYNICKSVEKACWMFIALLLFCKCQVQSCLLELNSSFQISDHNFDKTTTCLGLGMLLRQLSQCRYCPARWGGAMIMKN